MNLWKTARPPSVVSLVTSVSGDGRPNASPKSWWSPVSYKPPLLMVAIKPGSDTQLNVEETGLFVLHIAPQGYAQEVLHTAKPLPRGEMELDDVGVLWEWLDRSPLERPLPYVAYWPWMACWVQSKLEIGDHWMYIAQVGLAGGFPPDTGVSDVLLHRGRNRFVAVGEEFDVEPY